MPVPNNSTVRWFHSEMPGAPQITATTGDLIAILDACLINGFGTATPDGNKITISGGVATVEFSGGNDFEKHAVIEITGATPAELNDVWRITGADANTFTFDCPGIPNGNASGSITVKRATPGYWEKTYGDALKGAYRSTHPDATGFFLRVDHSTDYGKKIPVRCYETMTGIDTGSNPFPNFTQEDKLEWNIVYSTSSSYWPNSWALIADDRWIWFLPKWNDSNGLQLFSFGDFNKAGAADNYNCAIMAYPIVSSYPQSSGDGHEVGINNNKGCWIARGLTLLDETPKGFNRLAPSAIASIAGDAPYPNPATNGHLFISPVVVYDTENIRGTVPGLKLTPSNISALGDTPIGGVLQPIDPLDQSSPAILLAALPLTSYNMKGATGFDIWGPWR